MSRNILIGLIAALLVLGVVIWAISRKTKKTEVVTPVLSVYAFNQTKNVPATQSPAVPNDIVIYTLRAENQSDKVIPGYIVEANISEVTDKATLVEASGASYNSATNSLVWTPLDIPANGSIQKQFSVRVNPFAAGSTPSPMRMKFNNEVVVTLASPQVAGRGVTSRQNKPFKAPVSGPADNLSFWLAIIATAGFAVIKKFRASWG
jgi:hypothetical protein